MRRVALRIDPDVAAGDGAIMQRDPDIKWLAVGPLDCVREREQITRNLQCRAAIDFFVAASAPVGEDGVTDKLINRATALRDEIAGFAKPDAKLLGKVRAVNFFGHGAEPANVANEQRHRADGRSRASHGAGQA